MTEKKANKGFLRGIRQEFKKIVWPTKKELINSTIVVLTSIIIIAAFIKVVDEIIRFLLNLAV